MFNARVTARHATRDTERHLLTDEAEFRPVLRDEFGLKMTDDVRARWDGGRPGQRWQYRDGTDPIIERKASDLKARRRRLVSGTCIRSTVKSRLGLTHVASS